MQAEIAELNDKATKLGCVIYPAADDQENVVVIFAGAGGVYFNALTLMVGIPCEVIYFQDCFSAWYQGSPLLPPVCDIATNCLSQQIGGRRAIFFGQSSGAYACLIAARFFQNSVTLAIAPQTYSDVSAKSRLNFVGDINVYKTVVGLVDVLDHWRSCESKAFVAVVFSASEAGNPIQHHYWVDHLHAMRLLDLNNFHLYVVAEDHHNILQGRARAFALLLDEARTVSSAQMNEFLVRRLALIFASGHGSVACDDAELPS